MRRNSKKFKLQKICVTDFVNFVVLFGYYYNVVKICWKIFFKLQKYTAFRSREQIKKAILENEFLGNLEEVQVDTLVSAMYPKVIPPNTLVIQEGDIGIQVLTIIMTFYDKEFHASQIFIFYNNFEIRITPLCVGGRRFRHL